ncbi:minor capsid protein [Streptomyces syringium]|uniref:minor capsid protein n=1 Tax=Streptomyces syringium TaxID=76729 RepID=UPI003AAF3820
MTPLQEIARLLEELGLGTYRPDGGDGDIFLGGLPSTPAAALALSRAVGGASDARLGYDESVVLARVRGAADDAPGPESRAQAVYDALHGLGSRQLPGGSWLVLGLGVHGGPVYTGRDADRRDEWTATVRMELHRPTTERP